MTHKVTKQWSMMRWPCCMMISANYSRKMLSKTATNGHMVHWVRNIWRVREGNRTTVAWLGWFINVRKSGPPTLTTFCVPHKPMYLVVMGRAKNRANLGILKIISRFDEILYSHMEMSILHARFPVFCPARPKPKFRDAR